MLRRKNKNKKSARFGHGKSPPRDREGHQR
jgi:hypothetical protein